MATDETPNEPQQPAGGAPDEGSSSPAEAQPAAPEQPAPAEQPAPSTEQPAPSAEQPASGEQAAAAEQQQRPDGQPQGGGRRRRRRRGGGQGAQGDGQPQAGQQQQPGQGGQRRRRNRPAGAPQVPRSQRQKLPLPFPELRSAAQAVSEIHGGRQALRDAFSVLADKERKDLSRLVSEDGEWRIRARNIAAGSLGAGRVGKAMAAQIVSMAQNEDVWAVTLPKEEAAERLARVRNARRRDDRRRERMAERDRRTDRLTRDQAQKARDGRVGAQIRIILEEPKDKGERRSKKKERRQGTTEDLLSRLGY